MTSSTISAMRQRDLHRRMRCVARTTITDVPIGVVSIYLFGSIARGDADTQSDVNLAVVIPNEHENDDRWATWRSRAHEVGANLNVAVDIVTYLRNDAVAALANPASLLCTIAHEGERLAGHHLDTVATNGLATPDPSARQRLEVQRWWNVATEHLTAIDQLASTAETDRSVTIAYALDAAIAGARGIAATYGVPLRERRWTRDIQEAIAASVQGPTGIAEALERVGQAYVAAARSEFDKVCPDRLLDDAATLTDQLAARQADVPTPAA